MDTSHPGCLPASVAWANMIWGLSVIYVQPRQWRRLRLCTQFQSLVFFRLVLSSYLQPSSCTTTHWPPSSSVDTGEMALEKLHGKKKSPCSLVVTWEEFYNPSTLAQQASVWRSPYIASSCLGGNMVLPAPDKYLRDQRLFKLERS